MTPSVLDPITVAEAKAHAHITSDDQDAQVYDWIKVATRKVERDTELALLTQTVELTLEGFPYGAVLIPIRPIQTITSVKYYDSLGVLQTVTSTDYLLDAVTPSIGLALNATWPADVRMFQPVVIRMEAGYASADLVPADLRHAVRVLVAHYSENRQGEPLGQDYDALIAPYVLHRAA